MVTNIFSMSLFFVVVKIVSTPTPLLSNIDKQQPATQREDKKGR